MIQRKLLTVSTAIFILALIMIAFLTQVFSLTHIKDGRLAGTFASTIKVWKVLFIVFSIVMIWTMLANNFINIHGIYKVDMGNSRKINIVIASIMVLMIILSLSINTNGIYMISAWITLFLGSWALYYQFRLNLKLYIS